MRYLNPILFVASIFVTYVVMGVTLVALDKTLGLHTLWRVGDVEAGLVLVILLVPGIAGVSRLLLKWEHLSEPKIADHLRHCFVAYTLLVLCGGLVAMNYQDHQGGLGFAYLAFLCVTLLLSILTNASVLAVVRGRSERSGASERLTI
jgi:hypothetical protein